MNGAAPDTTAADRRFLIGLWLLGGVYLALIAAMLLADASFTSPNQLVQALRSREIRYAIRLSLLSCSLTTLLSLWVAVPIGYLMSRTRIRGKALLDALLDIPIVLPPLVIGLSLLILFQTPPGRMLERVVSVTYAIPGVILAQFTVASAFAVRTLRATFDQLNPRQGARKLIFVSRSMERKSPRFIYPRQAPQDIAVAFRTRPTTRVKFSSMLDCCTVEPMSLP